LKNNHVLQYSLFFLIDGRWITAGHTIAKSELAAIKKALRNAKDVAICGVKAQVD